jgi:hypothetical protein
MMLEPQEGDDQRGAAGANPESSQEEPKVC